MEREEKHTYMSWEMGYEAVLPTSSRQHAFWKDSVLRHLQLANTMFE